jgi:hypothetical protein
VRRFHTALRSWWIQLAWIAAVSALGVVLAASPGALAASPWVVVSSPNSSSTEQNVLLKVACVSYSRCWAVGSHFDSGLRVGQTLIEGWNGSSWSIVASPNVPGEFQELRGVACAAPDECWAVGWHSSPPQTLIERWNGTSWSIASSPDPGDPYAQLFDVTCASRSECWAVGWHFKPGDSFGYPLIERWDGAAWSAIHPPTPNGDEGGLFGVTCSSRSRCWAVGTQFEGSAGASLTLVEEWNGKSWSVVSSPNPSTAEESTLGSVTCQSAANCWAVGSTAEAGGGNRNATLVEKWNGRSWSLVPSANTSRAENFLQGVSCVRRSHCWAVGSTQDSLGTHPEALIEEWNGSNWSVVSSPSPSGSIGSALGGVTCPSNGCWAVGTYNPGVQFQTLIEHNG